MKYLFFIRFTRKSLAVLAVFAWAGMPTIQALAATVDKAANFTLFDEQGKAVELHYHQQADAVILIGHRLGSALVQESVRAVQDLLSEQAAADVPVFMINPQSSVSRAELAADKARIGSDYPLLQDNMQLVASTLALSHAGEVLVIDPTRWQIVYRGPVIGPGSEPARQQLQALLTEQTAPQREPVTVAFSDAWAEEAFQFAAIDALGQISYARTIAPLLAEKCASCHREGGIAPWAMSSHQMVQGFSPMIREVILTKRMPPWHADPEVNSFKHDLSLSADEARKLVHWIDTGAARGEGEDPLLAIKAVTTEWEMGEPDLIVELPEFPVPATGVLDYQFFEVKNPLDRDVWVKAVQIAPGDRQVVHHAIATFGETSAMGERVGSGESLLQAQLMTFVPGNETYEYPENTGVFIPQGSSFFTQMHYTTYGQETVDKTRIGLYFSEEEPQYMLQHYSILDQTLHIPAGAAAHEEAAYYQFQRDAVIYSLFPHAHYRGRSSQFSLVYPDGSERLVLSVPNYDFNWQRYFQFEEPLEVPAGTKVIHSTVYDNSSANLSNPDPTVSVRFGEQTWEEMLYGGISFRYADARPGDNEVDPMQYLTSIGMGFMDTDMDGKVTLDEMPERQRQSLALAFVMLDKDKSGGLEHAEFRQLMSSRNGF
ncbi:MAG: redoxin domain-containing protein [Pseudomonadales bacterium]|nr:redoxin domain-containing protein [Pseudomonadales bacterium]